MKDITPNHYRSKLEASVALYLKSKKIPFSYEKFRYQLIPPYQYAGKIIRGLTYIPDFVINLFDKELIIEVKGYRREDYVIKSKLFILTTILTSKHKIFCEIGSVNQLETILQELTTEEHKLDLDTKGKNKEYRLTMKSLLLCKGGKKKEINHIPNHIKKNRYGSKGNI